MTATEVPRTKLWDNLIVLECTCGEVVTVVAAPELSGLVLETIDRTREAIKAHIAAGRVALTRGDVATFTDEYDKADLLVGRLGELLELRDRR